MSWQPSRSATRLKKRPARYGLTLIASVLIGASVPLSSCAGICKNVKYLPPPSPCPDKPDLLKDAMEREDANIYELVEREVCLITLVKKYQAIDIWKKPK